MQFAKSSVLLLLCLIVSFWLYAQQGSTNNQSDLLKPIEVIPPSPNAGSLGKFGGIDFGLNTGSMRTSMPLFTYSSRNLKVPVSLSYNTNGFKVDEISSRAGVSWDLNAGGVITRTVYGGIDEYSQRITPPAFSPLTRDLIDNFLKGVSYSSSIGGHDAQPDKFSFNFCGYSGQFILDQNLQPVLITKSNLLVENNLLNGELNFKITTPNGAKYYFGARETTSRYNSGQTCGHAIPDFTPTAFYLTKIVHPDNDSISFTYGSNTSSYKTGISQSNFYHLSSDLCRDGSCPDLGNYISTCASWLASSEVVLKEISSESGGRMVFIYRDRMDLPGDSLISRIEVHAPFTDAIIKRFDLAYYDVFSGAGLNDYNSENSFGYRHFLKSVTESSPDLTLVKKTSLVYNDFTNLPRRLSYAQDHYGFYNGKYTNTSLIPKGQTLAEQMLYFPSANADREPDPGFSVKGLLSKIIYPTGGSDTIMYEGNTVNETVEVSPPPIDFPVTADSQDPVSPTANSQIATLNYGQDVVITGTCEFYGTAAEDDPIHNKAIVYFYDNSTVLFQTTLLPGQTIAADANSILTLQTGHSYYLKVVAYGTKVRGYASFTVRIGNKTYNNANVIVGGVRVVRVITRNALNKADMIKKYYYASANDLSKSSGVIMYQPGYIKNHTVTTPCSGLAVCDHATCGYVAAFSSSQINLFAYSSQPISYQYVTESFGENFENGGIEHQYTVQADVPGQVYLNDAIIGAPLSNLGYSNGREIRTYVFKKAGNGFLPVKITYNHFKDDPRYGGEYSSWIVNRKGDPGCIYDPPSPRETDIFDVYRYSIFTNWSYVDTSRTLVYDNNGQTYTEQVVVTEYGNIDHCMPTKITTNESDLRQSITANYYPEDITLTGDEETARQALLSKHIINPVLKSVGYKDNNQVSSTTVNYKVYGAGVVAPYEVYLQTYQNTPEKRNQFPGYNMYGQLTQQSKPNDQKVNYLWDYNSMYPVGMVSNADSADIAYAGFEADGSGNWNIAGSTRNAGGMTGNACYQLSNGTITKAGLTTATTYIISYWTTNSTPFTISGTQGAVLKGKTINGWTYFEHKVTGVDHVAVPQTPGLIDELRLYPVNAQMTTYSYAPLIGVTSTCMPDNAINYYEYDGLGRLRLVKDQDGNIIKTYEYHYTSAVN